MAKYFVTTPIYYVNAAPHIGHTYTLIAADVLARFHRERGRNVLFATGTDENSQKNVEAAEQAGEDVQSYVDRMAASWQKTFDELGFSYDAFVRTTSEEHEQAVRAMIERLEASDDIYLGDYEGLYCVGCEDFVSEADLVDGKCPHHNKEPETIKEKNYFFRLSKYREKLLQHYNKHPEFVRPESARNKMLDYIANEMEDISISRQAREWGIRMPQDESHAVYVWFDALINYLTVTGFPDDTQTGKWWPADVHIIGKDIIKFHCAIWPAMLASAGLPLPEHVFAHGFFTVDDAKISKSLGNAIDPLELANEYPFDAVRYYLLREIPFGSDGDFSHDRLKERYNADLANGLGNLVSRTLNMIETFTSSDPSRDTELSSEVVQYLERAEKYTENLAFDQALQSIWNAIAWADGYIEAQKPWELAKAGDQKRVEEVLSTAYAVLVGVNSAIAPYMPETHQRLSELLQARPLKKPQTPLFARKE